MAYATGALQQQTVLWEGVLELQRYGELTAEVTFAQPVLVTGIRATAGSIEGGLQLPQLVKGHAKNMHTPTAAWFALLFNAVSVSQQETLEWPVDQVFPTQHVWLRGRCRSISLQLLGYALDEAPQQIKAAAEARFGPLPEASPLLSLPSTQQDSQQGPAHAPSLPRPPGKQLPLGKMPPAFVLTLAPLAQYWGRVRKVPLPPGSPEIPSADMDACEEMAEAVLAAQRGSPAALKAKLAHTRNVRGFAVDWDGIRDNVLDMVTYCCSALADGVVAAPTDLGLATAGVCAAIMLAACQDGAAQFLAWPNGDMGVAGAIAVRDLVSIPNMPWKWQVRSMGLVDLLLESCPAVAGPTLQGTLNPAGIPEPQSPQHSASDISAGADDNAEAHAVTVAGDDADGSAEAGSMHEQHAGAEEGVPAAKRQRVSEFADVPGDATGYPSAAEGAAAAAAGELAATHAEQAAAGMHGKQDAQNQPLPPQQLRRQSDVDGSNGQHGDDDDALIAGLEWDSDSPDNGDTDLAGARRKRRKRQQDGGAASDADGQQDGGDGAETDGWGGDRLDRSSEELVDGAGRQHDGGNGDGQQQEVTLLEGDYPEADEDAIRAEAAAKAARRGVERRPPVCALAQGQLYNAILQLSMSPMHHNAAISCKSVLRRLRAYQCLDTLQATVSPLLSGKVDPLSLTPQDLCDLANSVAAAANDLAALVLQPPTSSRSLFLYELQEGQADGTNLLQQQVPQEADYCVLQLLLSFQALELLGAVNCCVGMHLARVAHRQHEEQRHLDHPMQQTGQQPNGLAVHPSKQQQQQAEEPAGQLPQQPTEPSDKQHTQGGAQEQQSQLCVRHAQLLDSVRALTSAVTASSGGWCFLAAAREGLAALAAAVGPTRQVSLDGGPFSPDSSASYDPELGWQAERDALTAAAAGFGGSTDTTTSSALVHHGASNQASAATVAAPAGDLSDSLQRLWLLVEATSAVQGAEDVLSGKDRSPGAVERLNAAMKTLFVGGFASEVGHQSLVAALAACGPAVSQLGVLLKHCSEVHAAAAAGEADQAPGSQHSQDRALNLSLGLRMVCGALYAPEILVAFISSPHIDAIATWLPLTNTLHETIREQLYQHEVSASAAAKAAFPVILSADLEHKPLHECGLPTAVLPGGAAAAKDSSEQVLLQLHGAVLTAHNLVQLWQGQDPWAPLGAGSAGKMLDWLHAQLPKLESVVEKPPLPADPEGVAPKLPKTASAAYVAIQAADATSQLDGAAAAGGAAPPAGKDVKSDAVVEFMRNAACRSAALCALHLIDMLLRGAPQSVRTMAESSCRKVPRSTVAPFVPTKAGAPSTNAAALADDGADAQRNDGFAVCEVVRELLEGVAVKANPDQGLVQVEVFELLERALRTATVALRSSDADMLWIVRGGTQQDILPVLQARTAAATLMRAACTTTASLLVHLCDADPQQLVQSCPVYNDSLLDALICAHSAVVTCQEGLQACVPHPQLTPFISRATDPALNPVQRAAADAAVGAASARVCGVRVLLLLEARQALAVCLRCWQLQGWWPDPVGALLGSYPRASAAADKYAKEDAEARKAGDPSAPPPPAPRQGPRQLLSSLLGLADLCPEEWPTRGASKVAAKQRNDAAADTAGGAGKGCAFDRPSLILLRQKVANTLESHWDKLEGLIDFGLSCSTRMARLALVRMLARMAGLGAGMAPLLAPKVLLALCARLYSIQQLRKGLADRLHVIKALMAPDSEKQHMIDQEINMLHRELRSAVQVSEVLLPLCSAPSIKSVLTEHKAAGVLGKAVYALTQTVPDLEQMEADEQTAVGQTAGNGLNGGNGTGSSSPCVGPGLARVGSEAQFLSGLLLRIVGVLMDADISMNPWAGRSTRELQDSPSISTSSITAAWLLAAAPHLNPANMATLANLLIGYQPAAAAAVSNTNADTAGATAAEVCSSATAQQSASAASQQPSVARVAQSASAAQSAWAAHGTAGGSVCLMGSAKGRAALLQVGRQWQILEHRLGETQEKDAQARPGGVSPSAAAGRPPLPLHGPPGPDMTQAELQMSGEWAAATLEAIQHAGGPDPSHAASCAAIAQVMRELAGSSSSCAAAWQEYMSLVEAERQMKPQHSWTRFIEAAKSAAAAHQPGGPNQQSLATLLSYPPLLLACDASCLDFWSASAASVQHAAACALPAVRYPHNAAQPTASASSWWPRPQLVAGSNPAQHSQAIEDAVKVAEDEDRKRRERADEGRPGGGGDDDDQGGGGGLVPAVYAKHGPQLLKDSGSRKASKHVDDYQREAAERKQKQQQKMQRQQSTGDMPPPLPRPPLGAGAGGGATACYQCGKEGHFGRDCPENPAACFNCGSFDHLARDCPDPDRCHNCGQAGHLARDCPNPGWCHRCGQEGHLARDCSHAKVRVDRCVRCGEVGHLATQCKAPRDLRGPPPPGPRGPGPGHGPGGGPRIPPPPPRGLRNGPGGPGAGPGAGPGCGPGGRPMQQASPPQQLSPCDSSGAGGPPADPRLKARRASQQQQQQQGGDNFNPSPGRSPLSPAGDSSGLLRSAGGGGAFAAMAGGVLPPGLGPAAAAGRGGGLLTPPAAAAVPAGAPGAALTPGGETSAAAAAGARAGSDDADAALLQGLRDDSQDAVQDDLQGLLQDALQGFGEGAGIGDDLDELLGGAMWREEEEEQEQDQGAYGVSEAGGL